MMNRASKIAVVFQTQAMLLDLRFAFSILAAALS
jgi:hypothetical protein